MEGTETSANEVSVSLTRALSSRHHVEALAEDATAEEHIEAVSNMNDTSSDWSED